MSLLKLLSKAKPLAAKANIKASDKELVDAVCECTERAEGERPFVPTSKTTSSQTQTGSTGFTSERKVFADEEGITSKRRYFRSPTGSSTIGPRDSVVSIMEHTKKMILVDPRMVDSLRASNGPPVPDAASHSLLEMDREMRNALDRNDVDFQDKAQLYQQVLWRYLKRFDQYRDKPLGTVMLKQSPGNLFDPATKVDGGTD